MSGALVNLVSKGVQDAYLTGDPQVSFYRQNYKRYSNFAMKPVEVLGIGSNAPNAEITFKIPPKGDLISYFWIDCATIADAATTAQDIQINPANTPTQFTLYIGGKQVDQQDAFFINNLWTKFLATSASKSAKPSAATGTTNGSACFFPLHFFSCDNNTTPIPLVALQYQEVEIRVKQGPNVSSNAIRMFANYVQLDTSERQWFTETTHDMLITQTQKISASATGCDLQYLNHPVKALMWGNSTVDNMNLEDVQLYVNGNQYFDVPMPGKYLTSVVYYQHTEHGLKDGTAATGLDTGLYMFPLGLYPCRHQPTGTLNFSRVDNAKLNWTMAAVAPGTPPTDLYAVNYNVFRIQSGLGGVRFSN